MQYVIINIVTFAKNVKKNQGTMVKDSDVRAGLYLLTSKKLSYFISNLLHNDINKT